MSIKLDIFLFIPKKCYFKSFLSYTQTILGVKIIFEKESPIIFKYVKELEMKICFLCDLHLPFDKKAIQYDALKWALTDIKEQKPDCVIFAGDVTANGNIRVYEWFIGHMQKIKCKFLYIPGNSDLRDGRFREKIRKKASDCLTIFNGIKIFAVNDSDGNIDEDTFALLEQADESSIVFMHHPFYCLGENTKERFLMWKRKRKSMKLFYGHEHFSAETENGISLQALDPDKAIGEEPCITYYDTDTDCCRKSYYLCPVPQDLFEYLGISCYRASTDISFATAKRLKYLELRPNVLSENEDRTVSLIDEWRRKGGKVLSVHLSDVVSDGKTVRFEDDYDKLIELGVKLKAERFIQHVPVATVLAIKNDKTLLKKIGVAIAEKTDKIPYKCVIGVENMHMTQNDLPNKNRRFGYTPEEIFLFMRAVAANSKHKIGVNLDIGHARNNFPYSQKYTLSTWYSLLGKYAVSYHIHQVTYHEGQYYNHMPITDVYGKLISYASFFKCWEKRKINRVPCIFEMRPQGSYEITLNAFKKNSEWQIKD